MNKQRPTYVTDDPLEFLDELRESGKTNMYGATPYILREFPGLTQDAARKVLQYWMDTFSERRACKQDEQGG